MTILPPLSELPVIFPDGRQFVMISPDGEIRHADIQTATFEIEHSPVLVCHRLWTEARLGCVLKQPLDVLELFGFVRPAQFCLPAPDGLAMRLESACPDQRRRQGGDHRSCGTAPAGRAGGFIA